MRSRSIPEPSRSLRFLYGTAVGRLLLKPLVQPGLSRAAGWLLSQRVSRCLIAPFVRRSGINLGDYLPEDYGSYNEFFCRRIRPELRPLSNAALVSPCDGRASAYPITDDLRFTVKHTVYTVSSLLRNEALAWRFAGGTALILRLAVDDYHRYCFPMDGTVGETGTIPGCFHTVQPIANDQYPIYKENTRQYTVFRSEELGDVAMVEVGALLVGRIVNHPVTGTVCRGQEKGYFQFGGSTIVLLLQKHVSLPQEFFHNTAQGWETRIYWGESLLD